MQGVRKINIRKQKSQVKGGCIKTSIPAKDTSRSRLLYSASVNFIPGGAPGSLRREFHSLGPLVISRGLCSKIWDVDGKEYLDYHMAFGAIILGHNDKDVNDAIKRQADKIILHGVGLTDLEIDLAEKLRKIIPSIEMMIFNTTGSEAVLTAIRLARAYTGRDIIVKFSGNYHGWHDYSLYNTKTPATKGRVVETLGIPNKVQETVDVLPYNDVVSLENYMDKKCDDVAGIILEPVAHSMGAIPAHQDFIQKVDELARTCGSILIFDEIITAIRHNLHGMQSELGITPDITVLGKALANGMPIGVVGGKSEIMDLLEMGVASSGTYQSHPLSLAASLATLNKIEKTRIDIEISKKGEEHSKILKDAIEDQKIKAIVAGFRSIISVYFDLEEQPQNLGDVMKADMEAYKIFALEMRRHGVIFSPNPLKRIHLSHAHSEEDKEKFTNAVYKALKFIKKARPHLIT